MTAKNFLLQIKKIDRLIENKLAECEQLKSIATGLGGNAEFGDRIKTSGNADKMAEIVSIYVDLEKEIEANVDELIKIRKDVISVIEMLNPDEYNLLHKVYVQDFTLGEVAYDLGKSYTWATTTHKRAKSKVQKILDERQGKMEKATKCM